MRNSRKLTFIVILTALSSTLAKAGEPPLSFRNIWLGDPLTKVESKVANEFERPDVATTLNNESYTIETGDNEGVRRGHCPIAAVPLRRVSCLFVRFIFWPDRNENRLNIISVQQSFLPAIRLEDILAKLQKSYGLPRLSFKGEQLERVSYEDPKDNVALIWGGNKTPKAPYRPGFSTSTYLDYERIGGRYITGEVYNDKGMVSGY